MRGERGGALKKRQPRLLAVAGGGVTCRGETYASGAMYMTYVGETKLILAAAFAASTTHRRNHLACPSVTSNIPPPHDLWVHCSVGST